MITSKVLAPSQVEEVIRRVYLGRWSMAEISKDFSVSVSTINRIHEYATKNIGKLQLGIYGFGKRNPYWETEAELFKSVKPKYKPEDLKGWEKDQFEKLSQSSQM